MKAVDPGVGVRLTEACATAFNDSEALAVAAELVPCTKMGYVAARAVTASVMESTTLPDCEHVGWVMMAFTPAGRPVSMIDGVAVFTQVAVTFSVVGVPSCKRLTVVDAS